MSPQDIYNAIIYSGLKKTLPPNAFIKPEDDTEESKEIRFKHLIGLLILLYKIQSDSKEIYLDKNENFYGFHRYIRGTVINNFPYKCFGNIITEVKNKKELSDFQTTNSTVQELINHSNITANLWNNWIEAIWYTPKFSVSKPKINLGIDTSETTIISRSKRVLDLSSIMYYLSLVFRKYTQYSNDVNKPYNKVYGNRFAMSGFMGNEIIRKYPFKDIEGFLSENYAKDNSQKSRYEHWTPTGIFAKTIAIQNLETLKLSHWFDFLYYFYRTIRITLEEDRLLEKSLRPINQYDQLGIKVFQENEWNFIHNLENSKTFLKTNDILSNQRENFILSLINHL